MILSLLIVATGTGTACDLDSGVTEDNDDSDGGEVDGATGDFDVTQTNYVTVRKTSIAGGSRFKAIFRVTVD